MHLPRSASKAISILKCDKLKIPCRQSHLKLDNIKSKLNDDS